jgi:glutamate-ammonia-ligase adenylyltransferase
LLALARFIDPDATERALADLPAGPGQSIGALLGAAFPPLLPRTDWQLAAIERIARSGWRAGRTHGDLLDNVQRSAGNVADAEGVRRGIRRAAWEEKARIALRELLPLEMGGAEIRVTARELSELADATLEVAVWEAAHAIGERYGSPLRSDGMPSQFVVFGMGKLGGFELNAGSDVDIVFFYDTDDGQSRVSLHEHWTRVARRAVATIEDSTPDGSVWRVDLRLRPEGSRGPLVNSLGAAERYYVTWGRLWERSAMLRSRPIAGDMELGARFREQVLRPFVYRRDVDPSIATTLAELTERSRVELSVDPVRDLKLGRGGIREAEFFVQALQLIWGGRDANLRVTGTLLALSRLRAGGLVSDLESSQISSSYLLLRQVEHRVQWMTGIQTHLMPLPGPSLEHLARSLAYGSGGELVQMVNAARRSVRTLFESLMPTAPHPPSPYYPLLYALAEDDRPAIERLVAERFGSADIGEHLAALTKRPDGLLGQVTLERFPELANELLDAIRESSDPELAAQQLRGFFGRFTSPGPYVTALAENDQALRRLVTALGASVFVGDAVMSRPDLADVILFWGSEPIVPEQEVHAEIVGAFEGAPSNLEAGEQRERFLRGTRRAKRRVMIQVAVADLAGSVRNREATRLLSRLADELVDRAVRFELGDPPKGFAVIAVGKLGGREIGYGSDLDVLFVFDPAAAPSEEEAAHHFSKVAQRVIRLISEPHPAGPGYDLDTRLRPSGGAGMLVTSLDAFARYHGLSAVAGRPSVMSSGAAWERQALLRARFCGGDRQLGDAAVEIAHKAAYEGGPPAAEGIHHIRMRMERELSRERPGQYNLKTGRGGLLDIEFATQWLQMRHGTDPCVRTTDTAEALDMLLIADYLDRRGYEVFRDGYRFLRRLEQRIHVLRGRSDSVLDEHGPGIHQLARRMSFQAQGRVSAAEALMARYRSVTSEVRANYLRVLGLEHE